jgi:glycosidase
MKKIGLALLLSISLFACKDDAPDVSGIDINIQVKRFDQDFFAIDTNNLMASLQDLSTKYPVFLNDFLFNILELPPITDTSLQAHALIRKFIADYRPIKDSVDKAYSDFDEIAAQIKKGLQYVKHYFPNYSPPPYIITFVGPLEGFSDVITSNALAVGLQLHMGSRFSYYTSEIGQQLFPSYISRRFTRETIAVNCMKNVIDDLAPMQIPDRPLVEQMVEAGKKLYVLQKIMPHTPDTLLIGYTKNQLEGCEKSEGNIWHFFVSNNLLFTQEPPFISTYMGDGPHTPEFGEASPGAIGHFVGWQIVKKWMSNNSDVTLEQLLNTDPNKIFQESKYRPN